MELVGFDGVEWDHAGLPRHPRLVVAFVEPLLRQKFVHTSNVLTGEMAISMETISYEPGELKVCDSAGLHFRRRSVLLFAPAPNSCRGQYAYNP